MRLDTPLLTRDAFEALASMDEKGFKGAKIYASYKARTDNEHALADAVNRLCEQAEELVRDGVSILAISDRVGEGEVRCLRC